jgi:hypothetical protein
MFNDQVMRRPPDFINKIPNLFTTQHYLMVSNSQRRNSLSSLSCCGYCATSCAQQSANASLR